jgi:hypothetical protein
MNTCKVEIGTVMQECISKHSPRDIELASKAIVTSIVTVQNQFKRESDNYKELDHALKTLLKLTGTTLCRYEILKTIETKVLTY